jgi:thiamine kinase-like enzyme
MVKLFSPLAKLRLAPERRGLGDETAGDEALGPRLLYRSADGLICEWIEGETLTEADLHAPSSSLPALIAPKLAALHGEPLAAVEAGDADGPVLWQFLHAMIEQIALGADALPEGFTLAELRAEVERMRRRCDALRLPVVRGHGDLKPSNVMHLKRAGGAPSDRPAVGGDGDAISFIDFELSGCHYRGYDLFKLFRTAGPRSAENMRAFLGAYLACRGGTADDTDTTPADAATAVAAVSAGSLELDELQAEANAAEPLTWLEAAVFFLFAISVYPSQAVRATAPSRLASLSTVALGTRWSPTLSPLANRCVIPPA